MEQADLRKRDGTLARPLSWATAELLALAEVRPRVALELLRAERPRLHLLAFILANAPNKPTTELLEGALGRPTRDILADFGFAHLRGLRRLLGRIPGALLQPADYRLLAGLLADPSAAQVLYHATEVRPELLANLQPCQRSCARP